MGCLLPSRQCQGRRHFTRFLGGGSTRVLSVRQAQVRNQASAAGVPTSARRTEEPRREERGGPTHVPLLYGGPAGHAVFPPETDQPVSEGTTDHSRGSRGATPRLDMDRRQSLLIVEG